MGFEYLLAALLMNAEEKRREKRRLAEEEAEWREERAKALEIKNYLAGKGYDHKRQRYLTNLARSSLREDRREFMRILGRPYCEEDFAIKWAVRAIADREGWTYYCEGELIYDTEYCRLKDWPLLCKDTIEKHVESIKDLQRKEQIWRGWVERNPKCWEANIHPEFYESEEDFALVVEEEYRKKQWK